MVRLIMVHGRDNRNEIKDTIQTQWREALHYGLERLTPPYDLKILPTLAWYGDIWRADYEGERLAGDEERAIAVSPATDLQAGIVREMLVAQGATFVAEDAERERGGEEERGVFDTLSKLVGTLEPYLPDPAARWIVQRFLYDVDDYFNKPDMRLKTMKRVADEIRASDDKVVLLAHSMGTIVAYDVLMNRNNVLTNSTNSTDYTVMAFISFGCPLGFGSVRRNVRVPSGTADSQGETPFPPNLAQWVNVYNKEDFVAAVREISSLYPSGDNRRVVDKDEGKGKSPGLGNIFGPPHDPRFYLSSIALVESLRPLLEPVRPPLSPSPPASPHPTKSRFGGSAGGGDNMAGLYTALPAKRNGGVQLMRET